MKYEEITEKIIQAFYKVYNTLGYGFLEKVYLNALYIELIDTGLIVNKHKRVLVHYKGNVVGDYTSDLTVENVVICELKTSESLCDDNEDQLIDYLKAKILKLACF
jgi:GxxExxY protein